MVLQLEGVAFTKACYQFLHEKVGAHVPVSVKSLELDFFSLRLCLASGLRDVDHLDALLVKLGHLASIDEWSGHGQNSDDVDEVPPEVEGLEALGLGDVKG
jgi:hypothetical protein